MKDILAFALILIASLAIMQQATADTDSSGYIVQFNNTQFGAPFEVSTTQGIHHSPRIAISGKNVYFAWLAEGSAGYELWFRNSSDGGLTFGEATKIADCDSPPIIRASGNNVYIAFGLGENVYVVSSIDKGKTFGKPVNVSRIGSTDLSNYLTDFDITASGNNVYVTWAIYFNIAFARSTDGGKTFEGPITVSPKDIEDKIEDSYVVHITASDNKIYIVWYDIPKTPQGIIGQQVSYAWSNDGGKSFHAITNFSETPGYYSHEPTVAASDDEVYMVWRDEGTESSGCIACLAFVKSTDKGNSFTSKRYVAEGAYPHIAVSGKNVYIAYMNYFRDFENIFVLKSADGGSTFGDPILVSNQTWGIDYRDQRPYPVLAAAGNNVYVSWRYTTAEGNHETFLSASIDAGESFSTINLSNNEGETSSPTPLLVAFGNTVHVAWAESMLETSAIKYMEGRVAGSNEDATQSIEMPISNPFSDLLLYLIFGIALAAGITSVVVLKRRRNAV